MKMSPNHGKSLRDRLGKASDPSARWIWGAKASVRIADLLGGTRLGGRLQELSGRTVLLATRDQLTSALALIELDGVAGQVIICPSDLSSDHLATVMAMAGVEAVVSDCDDAIEFAAPDIPTRVRCSSTFTPAQIPSSQHLTDWVLLTSGTTGIPKMLVHSLSTLTAAINEAAPDPGRVWATFYDIRRYGGLQILLRGLLSGGSLVLSSADEPVGDFLLRLGQCGVTHLSGTPSHWRRALMSNQAAQISPRYVRLSGEIADQAILDHLHSFYPNARIGHAYASTEAGVGFEVTDGREGFPASMVDAPGEVTLKIEDGSLRVRSAGTARGFIGKHSTFKRDHNGFVDTGDIVERRGDRYYFLGRSNGVINVGGLKIHPEEVEAAINRHPQVRMSLVRSKRSPITGSIVVADVVLREGFPTTDANDRLAKLKREILEVCIQHLEKYKIPATIRFVPTLDVTAGGKLARGNA